MNGHRWLIIILCIVHLYTNRFFIV